jgi:hypothetical protein
MSLKRRPPVGNVRRVAAIGQNMRGVMTNKAGRVVQFESALERSLLLRLDRDRSVRDYGSQPEMLHFQDDQGKRRVYTPDFIVWRRDGTVEIHEVTLTSRQIRPSIRLREAAATAVCQKRGWRYVVHTEQSLPLAVELANLLALFHYRPLAYAHPAVDLASADLLADGRTAAIQQLTGQLTATLNLPHPAITAALYHMLWHGRLQTDLRQPFFVQGSATENAMVHLALGDRP